MIDARGRAPRYDLPAFRRGSSYSQDSDPAEPLVRARAFAAVTDGLAVHVADDNLLAGSVRGFRSHELPPGASQAEYDSAIAACRQRGQRDFGAGFDHTLADYPALLAEGVDGIIRRIEESRARHSDSRSRTCLAAMIVALEGFRALILRHAHAAEKAGRPGTAEDLRAIAEAPPTTFSGALQLVWMVHLAFASEGRHHMALGRLDQYLLPYYLNDLRAGRLTRKNALGLLGALWRRLDEVGEVQNICIGGLRPDGSDATNELSYLILETALDVRTPHANLSARFHDGSPQEFYHACFETIRTGVGFPAVFNDHVLVPALTALGIPAVEARDYCMVGCIETMLGGRQGPWSDSRFNMPAVLLEAMSSLQGRSDPGFELLRGEFAAGIAEGIRAHAARINAHIRRFPVDAFPDPFLSALTHDCISRGRDVNAGGARFARFHGVACMGLSTVVDSLAAVRRFVFEEKRLSLGEMVDVLGRDFEGHEPLRQALVHRAPKYGVDDPQIDALAAWLVDLVGGECLKHRLDCGGRFVACMAANVQNISAGRDVGATPDGRGAGRPISDAASPYFGSDVQGPTALLHSVSVPDYSRAAGGTVINVKFEPEHFRGEEGFGRFVPLLKFFVRGRIPQLQFNFTGDETLRAARREPEKYRSLVVRVSGFSARFVRLDPEVQEDVIRRRAHG